MRAAAWGATLLLLLLGSAGSAAAEITVEAKDAQFRDNRFEPSEPRAAPSEDILVRNTGSDSHTLTSVDGAWEDVVVRSGQSARTQAPAAPGEYRFYCRFHASPQATPAEGMAGILRVAEAGGAPSPALSGDARTPGPGTLLTFAIVGALMLGARWRRR